MPNEKQAAFCDRLDPATAAHLDFRDRAFREEHLDDLARACIAEELAELFLVKGDAVFLDQRDEILRRVAGEGRGAKARIARKDNFPAAAPRLVKLQRPPPEIAIFRPTRAFCSSSATRRPRRPAVSAHIRPAAPPPITMTS